MKATPAVWGAVLLVSFCTIAGCVHHQTPPPASHAHAATCPPGCAVCSQGYCSACGRLVRAEGSRIETHTKGLNLVCAHMKPGDPIEVVADGKVTTRPSNGNPWLELDLEAKGQKCPRYGPGCYMNENPPAPDTVTLRNATTVGAKGNVHAWIEAMRCQNLTSDKKCIFEPGFVVTVRDETLAPQYQSSTLPRKRFQ